jgi:hypothetical protein
MPLPTEIYYYQQCDGCLFLHFYQPLPSPSSTSFTLNLCFVNFLRMVMHQMCFHNNVIVRGSYWIISFLVRAMLWEFDEEPSQLLDLRWQLMHLIIWIKATLGAMLFSCNKKTSIFILYIEKHPIPLIGLQYK